MTTEIRNLQSMFEPALREAAEFVERSLDALLPQATGPEARLFEAMRYAALGGGKRLRGFLVLQSGRLFGVDKRSLGRVAAAIECVHAYSLVHDDLPAMDDDDLRRGRPTCHKAFDEATAILTGDALQSLAFQVLACDPTLTATPATRLRLIELLGEASGTFGMAGGQAIDLAAQGRALNIAQIEEMHARKTGALIRASVLMAATCMPTLESRLYQALEGFVDPIGLAFQIQDDLLDVLGDVSTLGKAVGADSERAKPTHPAMLGVPASQERVRLLHAQALHSLEPFAARAEPLRQLAGWLLARSY